MSRPFLALTPPAPGPVTWDRASRDLLGRLKLPAGTPLADASLHGVAGDVVITRRTSRPQKPSVRRHLALAWRSPGFALSVLHALRHRWVEEVRQIPCRILGNAKTRAAWEWPSLVTWRRQQSVRHGRNLCRSSRHDFKERASVRRRALMLRSRSAENVGARPTCAPFINQRA